MTGLALGGNKTRKLQFIVADALAKGADTLVTAGAAQSNHCRQTAAAAASLGLECHLLLGGEKPDAATGNLLLDQLLGSQIYWCGNNRKGEDLPRIVDELKASRKKPYLVPYGGSNATGAMGFVDAMFELNNQLKAEKDSLFSHIVFASSSGGTHAGLMAGKQLLGWPCELLGIDIDKDALTGQTLAQAITTLSNQLMEHMGQPYQFVPEEVKLDTNYLGAGYGVVGAAEKEAIGLLASTEGILLDPVYTGRAMAGLIDMVRKGRFKDSDKVLFWHTGGAPALFAHADELGQ